MTTDTWIALSALLMAIGNWALIAMLQKQADVHRRALSVLLTIEAERQRAATAPSGH